MEASVSSSLPTAPVADHNTETIKKKLLQRGVYPTPKIIHTLRKKELQKSLRKSKKLLSSQVSPLTDYQKQIIAEEAHFQAIEAEYKDFSREIAAKTKGENSCRDANSLVGKPWERLEKTRLKEILSDKSEYPGDKLKPEHLKELSLFLEKDREEFRWLLDDDIELQEGWLENEQHKFEPTKRQRSEEDTIQFLVDKLSTTNLGVKDWRFFRMMKQSRLQFTEHQLLKIVEGLGDKGQWKHAMSVVDWAYSSRDHKHFKSRFVYTKLLSVLGKARRPNEALKIFNLMSEDCHLYPDMAAYHSIAVTLGQAGFLRELVHIIECMEQKPLKKLKNMHRKNWDPTLHPDVVVFNSVLNACIPSCRWKGVSWVFNQIRMKGLKPNGATYGLAMKVMLQSGKYDLVHELFEKMRRSGEALKALSYKVVVSALWKENKIDEAIQAVRNMEERGVVGTACVYYELACCLCNNGRWQEAMREIERVKKIPRSMPLVGVFTGMIKSALYGGHVNDCISIFEKIRVKWTVNIGIINIMLKVYGQNDMFSRAKELFEMTKKGEYYSNSYINETTSTISIVLDGYSYIIMLKASAISHQWEYFEYVYREMALTGYHLDQTKHDLMLVEASRAGKPHLLEHTFNKIMENGEIPRQSFFTELICQATTQRDYHRVITLLNAMAYAPWQVSEDQWKHFHEENRDRLFKDVISELLSALHDQDLPKELTVTNFLTSLSSVCVTDFSKGHVADAPPNPVIAETVAFNVLSDDDEDDDMRMLGFLGMDSDYETDDDEMDFDYSVDSEEETNEPTVPSANEILEVWKEGRKNDGFPLYQ